MAYQLPGILSATEMGSPTLPLAAKRSQRNVAAPQDA